MTKPLTHALIALFSVIAIADDSDFKLVQPFDNYMKKHLKWDNENLADKLSDYTQYTMTLAPFILALDDEKPWRSISEIGVTHLSLTALTHYQKFFGDRTRPNGMSKVSFWSGHTSAAFTSAGIICVREKDSYCAPALLGASMAGYLRIAANKHWTTDVLAGAIVGYSLSRHIIIHLSF